MNRFLPVILTFSLVLTAVSGAARAEEMSKEQIEGIVKEYILSNPKIVIESLENYQKSQQEAMMEEQKENAQKFQKTLASIDHKSAAGNPEGDVTIVEFFDYNCGYCKKALTEVQKLLEEDKNVHVIFKDMPILGPSSLETSKWSIAAERQGKYFEYHTALMNHQGQKDEAALKKLAKEAGLDVKQLQKDKDDPKIEETINENLKLAQELGIQGTPGFVIGDELVRGYVTVPQMKKMIEQSRKEKAEQDG